MEKVDENVKKLVNILENTNGTGENICNYGLVSDKGVFDLNWKTCHAGFRNLTSRYAKDEQGKRNILNEGGHGIVRPILGINLLQKGWFKFYKVVEEVEKITFLEWLYNYSPWSSTFVTKDHASSWEQGFFISDLDTPANLVIGGMIASRFTGESLTRLRVWYYLVDKGIDPNLAFLVSLNFTADNIEPNKFKISYMCNHSPLIDGGDKKKNRNFLDNKPNNLIEKYSLCLTYNSIDNTFHRDNSINIYIGENIKKLANEMLTTKEVKDNNPFSTSNTRQTSSILTGEELLQFTTEIYQKEFT